MGLLSRPILNQLERIEAAEKDIITSQRKTSTLTRPILTIPHHSVSLINENNDSTEECLLKDTVFGIAERTPTSQELLQVRYSVKNNNSYYHYHYHYHFLGLN